MTQKELEKKVQNLEDYLNYVVAKAKRSGLRMYGLEDFVEKRDKGVKVL